MRKSTIFISAVLTTFALVVLYGVVSAYRGTSDVSAAAEPTATFVPEPTDIPAPTQMVITPEQAAQLAVGVVGNSSLLSAESSNLNGVDAYKVIFTNNDVVYVGLDGQILSVQIAPVVFNPAPPVKHKNNNNNAGGGSSGGDDSNHEDHEEHDD